jgi:alpha-tubulin suppressor-like RCC1 family protein
VTRLDAPRRVAAAGGAAAGIAAGSYASAIVARDGRVYVCGSNAAGIFGLGDAMPRWDATELALPGGAGDTGGGAAAVAFGNFHMLLLTRGGAVLAAGSNGYGQLGTGDTVPRSRPAPVTATGATSGVATVAAGAHFSAALSVGGALALWGENSHGQLGAPPPLLRCTSSRRSRLSHVGTTTCSR